MTPRFNLFPVSTAPLTPEEEAFTEWLEKGDAPAEVSQPTMLRDYNARPLEIVTDEEACTPAWAGDIL